MRTDSGLGGNGRIRRASAPLGWAEAEACSTKSSDQLSALDHDRPCGDHVVSVLLRDVEMVTLERSARDVESVGELEQFLVGHVAHHVAPLTTLEPPAGFVDQDRHPPSMPWPTRCARDSKRGRLDAIR